MARILICEPNREVRTLLELLVERLGHEPLGACELAGDERPELLLVEPASSHAVALATRLRRRLGPLPVVCASILPPSPATLALAPVSYLVKPVRLHELRTALGLALAT